MSFKALSMITAGLSALLFLSLLLAPEVLFFIFQLSENEPAFIMARRASMLFLGLAVLSWSARASVHSETRQAICLGLSSMMLGLAVLGVFEFMRNAVGEGIFLAVAVEVILGVAYWRLWVRHQSQ